MPENITTRKATVKANRETVSLFGRFIRREFASNRDGNQVIIGVADDFHASKLAERQPAADINAAINIGRVGFTARNQIAPAQLIGMAVSATDQAVLPRMNPGAPEFLGAGLELGSA